MKTDLNSDSPKYTDGDGHKTLSWVVSADGTGTGGVVTGPRAGGGDGRPDGVAGDVGAGPVAGAGDEADEWLQRNKKNSYVALDLGPEASLVLEFGEIIPCGLQVDTVQVSPEVLDFVRVELRTLAFLNKFPEQFGEDYGVV